MLLFRLGCVTAALALPAALAAAQSKPTTASVGTSGASQILGRPTGHSIDLSVLSSTSTESYVEYGTAKGRYGSKTAVRRVTAGTPAVFGLGGLAADTRYYYRLRSRVPGRGTYASGAEHSFETQRAAGSSFTFTIDADPHNRDPRFDGQLYAITLANARKEAPDFHVDLGDTFMTEKARPQTMAEAAATFTEMRPYFSVLAADAPLFLVNGNHEGELGWLLGSARDGNLPRWSAQLRQTYYPNPVPNAFYSGSTTVDPALGGARDAYYAWTWGDALFVTLDPFWYTTGKPKSGSQDGNWSWTLGREQYDWLKATLQNSTARYKFVFTHHLVGGSAEARGGIEVAGLFEWGGNNLDGTYGFDQHRPGWGVPIHRLLVDNHVTAVFHGHDHVYVKQDLDGIVYQEVPQPSVAGNENTRLAADHGYAHGDVFGSSGHLKVTVTPSQVTVDYVRSYLPADERTGRRNGQVDHSYVIR